MAFKFNPFTGTLDQTGSGGGASYIDGEVQNFSALPQTLGTPAVDSAYLVREPEGTWLLGRKPAGIYIRTANTGVRADDWTHAGAFPDVFNDANFLLYDNGDSTKNLQFQLSGIDTATTRTLTVPNASGTLPLLETANTYTQNQALDGTNNTAPNQTAASGSSVMTRSLVDARWSKWFNSYDLQAASQSTGGALAGAAGAGSGSPIFTQMVTIPDGVFKFALPVPWFVGGQVRVVSYWTDRTVSASPADIAVWTTAFHAKVTTNTQTSSGSFGSLVKTVFTANYGGSGQARFYVVDQTVDFGALAGIDATDQLQIKYVELQRRGSDATDTSTSNIFLAGVHVFVL